MDQKTLQRLAEFEKSQQFYDALQFYRTKVTRSFRLTNASESAIPLVKHALEYFLKEKQYQCAADIIILFSESLSKNSTPQNDQIFGFISDAAAKVLQTAEAENANQNAKNEELLSSSRRQFVEISLQWTKKLANTNQEKKFGSARLHSFLANAYLQFNALELARNHLLLSDEPKKFASFLYKAWQTNGDESEFDLIIVQAVLQLLCIDRFPFARDVFNEFVAQSTTPIAPFKHPLLNFIDILFNTISTVNAEQFSAIMTTYSGEIQREESFKGYLSKIGQIYFGIRETQSGGGGLVSLLSGIMGGGENEEKATSHICSANQHLIEKKPSQPLNQPKSIQQKPPQPVENKMEVDDLD